MDSVDEVTILLRQFDLRSGSVGSPTWTTPQTTFIFGGRHPKSSHSDDALDLPSDHGDEQGNIFAVLDEVMVLYVCAWLSSTETTWMRCASRSCAEIFKVRNAPSSDRTYVYIEAVEEPSLDWQSLGFRAPWYYQYSIIEIPSQNRFSPLRVFRLDALDSGRLLFFEPQRRLALNLWSDKIFVLAAVENDVNLLRFAAPSLQGDRDVALAAVNNKNLGTRSRWTPDAVEMWSVRGGLEATLRPQQTRRPFLIKYAERPWHPWDELVSELHNRAILALLFS